MSKYIKLEDVVKLILEEGLFCDTQADREYSAEYVRQLPTFSDLVEVVRCKDCKHWNRNMMNGRYPDNVMCKCCEYTHSQYTGYTAPDDYCSFAEKVGEND